MAQNLVGITHVLFLAMENTIPAKAAAIMREGGSLGMLKYLKHFTFRMGGLVITILSTLVVFSGYLIHTFYGTEYAGYQFMLQGFCLIYIVVFVGYPMRYAIRTLENTKNIFYSFIISSCFSIAAAYPIIRWMGLYGVLVGLLITQLISFSCYCYALRKELPKVFS
jgi:O-antigen/teichoic acid export membrane protein